jgi:hypothetical protein
MTSLDLEPAATRLRDAIRQVVEILLGVGIGGNAETNPGVRGYSAAHMDEVKPLGLRVHFKCLAGRGGSGDPRHVANSV